MYIDVCVYIYTYIYIYIDLEGRPLHIRHNIPAKATAQMTQHESNEGSTRGGVGVGESHM